MTDSGTTGNVVSMPEVDKIKDSMPMPVTEGGTKKLIICFLGIFVSYFVYGLLQEKM